MKNSRNKTSPFRALKLALVAALLAAGLSAAPLRTAQAQCETNIQAVAMAGVGTGISVAAQYVHRTLLQAFIVAQLRSLMQVPTLNRLDDFNTHLHDVVLKEFWHDLWIQGLKDMTRQLVSSMIDQNFEFGKMLDHQSSQAAKRAIERAELEAKKQYEPDPDSCVFDTVARYKLRAMRTTRDTSTALSNQNSSILSNNRNSPGSTGGAAYRSSTWNTYVRHFCDPQANNRNSGCTTPGTAMGKHISPGRALFATPTLPEDEGSRLAVEALTQYMTGYEIVEPMSVNTLRATGGAELRQKNRAYMTQMDATTALISPIVGERSPGVLAPEVKRIREKLQVPNPSDKPSEYEIRQSLLEQLWTPEYYERLGHSPASITRKEVFLQSYNLQALYKLVEKFEKISTAYAIEGGNILDARDASRGNGQQFNTVRCSGGAC